jgi:hypothetical protein
VYTSGLCHLTWKTLQEANSSHYEIESSTDGINFNYTGKVAAAGTSSSMINYQFDDIHVKQGLNYYRLKMVDKNGQFVYSNTVVINVTIKGTFITAVYPSPFNDRVSVTVSAEMSGQVNCSLFDNTGKMLINVQSSLHKGINTIILNNLGNLSKGSYFLRVQAGETIQTTKLIK